MVGHFHFSNSLMKWFKCKFGPSIDWLMVLVANVFPLAQLALDGPILKLVLGTSLLF